MCIEKEIEKRILIFFLLTRNILTILINIFSYNQLKILERYFLSENINNFIHKLYVSERKIDKYRKIHC